MRHCIAWVIVLLGLAALLPSALAVDLSRIRAFPVSTEGLVAYYPCNEAAGEVLHDASGNGHDGKLSGEVTWVTTLPFGGALHFAGSDGFVDCGSNSGLELGRTGAILLWFKAEQECQGGLLAWTKGKAPADQRLVISLNTYVGDHSRGPETFRELGVYMADGTNLHRPFDSDFRASYFPPPERWVFFAVSFNGTSVDLYRDGVLFHSGFQALNPDTRGVPLWLGRCLGVGGASDGFRGLMREVRIYDRALSEPEVFAIYINNATANGHDGTSFHSVGITPRACPQPGIVFADLDYRGLTPAVEPRYRGLRPVPVEPPRLTAELLDARGRVVRPGEVRLLPAWGRAEARFDAHDLKAGAYTVRVTPRPGKSRTAAEKWSSRPATAAVTWPGRAAGWDGIKVLNNFCWELLEVRRNIKAGNELRFSTPRQGWVCLTIQGKGDLTVTLPTATPPVVYTPGGSATQESMRWLAAGEHVLTTSGRGSLRRATVRAIPTLSFGHYPHVGPDTGKDQEFLAKHVLPHVNTLITGGRYAYPGMDRIMADWARQEGRHWLQIVYRPQAPTTVAGITDWLAATLGLSDPDFHGVMVDEFDAGNDRMAWVPSYYDQWIEAVRQAHAAPARGNRMIIPYFAYNLFDYEKSSAFLREIVAGGSYLGNEVYLAEQPTASRAWVAMDEALGDLADDWEKAVPGATEKMILALSYLSREYWDPAVDFSVFMDMQMEYLATRPEFFGLAGIEWYVSHHAYEHYIRWAAQLCRHYGIEGHDQRLGQDPYNVSHLRNGDFAAGTDAWQVTPAEPDSVTVRNCPGYGLLQDRKPYWAFTDTPVLWLRRSATRPNRIAQTLTGLVPGRLYALRLAVADYQEFVKGTSTATDHALGIEVDGVEPVDDWYRTSSFKGFTQMYRTWRTAGKFSGENPYTISFHNRVFRAKAKTATLRLSDWASDTEPGGPSGQELMLNFVQVHPYPEL